MSCENNLYTIIIPIISVLIGVFVGALIARKTAVRLASEQEIRIACSNLRRAFVDAYGKLDSMTDKHGNKPGARVALRNARTKHRNAVLELIFLLPEPKKSAIKRAWIDFSGEGYEKQNKERPGYYIDELVTTKTPTEMARIIMAKMDKILDFANHGIK